MIYIHARNEAGIDEFPRIVRALNIFAGEVARQWFLTRVSVSEIALSKLAWPLRFVESVEQTGALGYHDETGNTRPEMLIGVSECERYGVSTSSCAAHEVAEALVDAHLNDSKQDKRGTFWAKEVGDPVQGSTFSIDGVEVQNFVLPNWFSDKATGNFDHLGVVKQAWEVPPQGYAQYWDPKKGWESIGQELGAGHTRPERRRQTKGNT